MLEPPEVLNHRYTLRDLLGHGNMAVVYRAHDDLLGREVAIKFLSPGQRISEEVSARFLREARIVARLAHPHIVTLYDAGREDHWHYLVLELVAGPDLRARMVQQGGPFRVDEALHLTQGVLRALAYAHAQGVIHRDIKPGNLMIAPDSQVKVMDFGLALSHGEARLTQEGMIIGTVLYMAPEILKGQEADFRSDLYAVGVVLYEMLTGQPPFSGDTMSAVVSQVLNLLPAAPRDLNPLISPELEGIILQLLEKDPARRFGSAAEVLEALPQPFEPAAPQVTADLLIYAAREDKAAALESERRRLASLLQTQVIESLNLLVAQAGFAEQNLAAFPQARMAVGLIASLARQSLQQVRDLEAHLHPAVLDSLGLEPALQALAGQITRAHGLSIDLAVERLPERLPPPLELALFRLAQEALDRAVTHAHAGRVEIQLAQRARRLAFRIGDNGRVETGTENLRAARQRLEQLGADVAVGVGPLGGVEVTAWLTLDEPITLTPREMDVIRLLAEGLSNKEIARLLAVSPRTVNFHLDNIYSKLGVSSRTEAAIYALRQGWVTLVK